MKLASGVAPVVAARRVGIAVGLGTDGVAGSNNDLDMWEAMDFAGKLAKVSTMDPTVLPAKDLLRMATIEGARAMKLDDRIGSLEAGKRADLVAVDLVRARDASPCGTSSRRSSTSSRRATSRSRWSRGASCGTASASRRSTRRRSSGTRRSGGRGSRRRSRRPPPVEMSLFVRTIVKKRDGGELSEGEIADFVAGVTDGTIPDEQAAAFLMAVCCRGMTTAEIGRSHVRDDEVGRDVGSLAARLRRRQALDGRRRRQGDARSRAAPRGGRRQGRNDVGPRPRAHGRHARQARGDPRASGRASRRRTSTASSTRSAARSSARRTRSPRPTAASTRCAT